MCCSSTLGPEVNIVRICLNPRVARAWSPSMQQLLKEQLGSLEDPFFSQVSPDGSENQFRKGFTYAQ